MVWIGLVNEWVGTGEHNKKKTVVTRFLKNGANCSTKFMEDKQKMIIVVAVGAVTQEHTVCDGNCSLSVAKFHKGGSKNII